MKYLSALLLVIGMVSCGTSVPKFTPKSDTVVVAYRRHKTWPTSLYWAKYTTYENKVYTDSPTLKESVIIDYHWIVKMSDTTPDGHGHQVLDTLTHRSIPLWQVVPDSLSKYFQIVTVGD